MNELFAIVPIEVSMDRRLTSWQMRVLIALLSFRGRDTNLVYPKRETLAQRCGLHVNNISKTTRELEELGWITKDGLGGNSRATAYRITVPTLAESTTIAESTTLVESTRSTLAESTRRIELTNELTNELTISCASPKKRVRAAGSGNEATEANRKAWAAYEAAYFARYKVHPVRNAKTNGQIAQIVKRIGADDAAHVAGWFVSHPSGWYVQKCHSLDALLNDCEALRTQWATGRRVTQQAARSSDRTGGAFEHFEQRDMTEIF